MDFESECPRETCSCPGVDHDVAYRTAPKTILGFPASGRSPESAARGPEWTIRRTQVGVAGRPYRAQHADCHEH
jgi:hypothetical protein